MTVYTNKVADSILLYLKKNGKTATSDIANHFKVTTMAVRQHLHIHMQNGFIAFTEQAAERGRPKRMWYLTDKADRLFVNDSSQLFNLLLSHLPKDAAANSLKKMYNNYTAYLQQELEIHRMLADKDDAILASEVLNNAGYMTEVMPANHDQLRFSIFHCPHRAILSEHKALETYEQELLSKLIPHCEVVLIDFKVEQAYYAEYKISKGI